jgi:hypothetical protein
MNNGVAKHSAQQQAIAQTADWVQQVIVKYNICPFARAEVERQSMRYSVCSEQEMEHVLTALLNEWQWLDAHPETETTLVILDKGFVEFAEYLDLLDFANELLVVEGYEGVYQIASFHPNYQFADSELDDAANFTNRSPFPVLHILREASLEKALIDYSDPESIPERNIEFARRKGALFFADILMKIKRV